MPHFLNKLYLKKIFNILVSGILLPNAGNYVGNHLRFTIRLYKNAFIIFVTNVNQCG